MEANERLKLFYRQAMGERLREFRESRGYSCYRVAKDGGIRLDQVQAVEAGDTNYTIDALLGYVKGSNLYLYFAEKSEDAEEPHDFDELVERSRPPKPNSGES